MAHSSREIAEVLAAEVAVLPPGSRVETESAVATRFGVGRAAARAALQELERRLLVRRVQGGGTFVASRIDYLISTERAPSWSRTIRDSGSQPRTVVLACDLTAPPATVVARLDLPEGSDTAEAHWCWLLRRVSHTDGLPASWGAEWVPRNVAPHLADAVRAEESLDRILRDMGDWDPVRRWCRASIEAAPADVAIHLGCHTGDPVWLVDSVNADSRTGRVLMVSERWIRADAIRVVFETGRSS